MIERRPLTPLAMLYRPPIQSGGISQIGFSLLKSQFTPTGEEVLARQPPKIIENTIIVTARNSFVISSYLN